MDSLNRTILILSDLHLGEGRRLWDGRLNLFEDFTADKKFVEFLSFHTLAYDRVTLVLNGNFFQMMRFRVGRGVPDILYETYATELVRSLMDAHQTVIEALRLFMEKPGNQMVYLPGDADRGILWPRVQEEIRSRISERVEFQNEAYQRDGLWVEHGHQYDPLYTPLEGAVFDLSNQVEVLRLPWGAYFQAHFVEPLRLQRPLFYRVRPMKTYLVWAFLFENRFFFRIVLEFIKMLWKAFTKSLYPGGSLRDVGTLFRRSADPESIEASAERILSNDAVHKCILAHSHIPDYRQYASGKEYFNSGTWTRTISLDVKSLGPIQKLTYVLVEFKNDQPQARLMEWRGKFEPISDYL